MDDANVDDEIDRMKLHEAVEKDRLKIAQYETGLAHFRQAVEKKQYEIGRLDERLSS